METLKNKERATIKDILANVRKLNDSDKNKVLWITYGMSLNANGKCK